MTDDGRIWLALCVVSLSTRHSSGHVEIYRKGSSTYWNYSFESSCWKEKQFMKLSEMEKDILYLYAQGYTVTEISEALCKATNTIKGYKRKLFEKLNVRNSIEALKFASIHQLL